MDEQTVIVGGESARVLLARAAAPLAIARCVARAALALSARVTIGAAADRTAVRARVALLARDRAAHDVASIARVVSRHSARRKLARAASRPRT
jgi:hypothetical protein